MQLTWMVRIWMCGERRLGAQLTGRVKRGKGNHFIWLEVGRWMRTRTNERDRVWIDSWE